jgi:hypothetical protein|tara:strand:- start:166 stop:741 length:576 start_codon:yes stop_codon:yes gene_type:complete
MKKILFTAILLCSFILAKSQNYDNKWVIGTSGSLVIFDNNSLGESYNSQLPKINISRYLFSGFSLDGSLTLSGLGDVDGLYSNRFSYNSIDGYIRYDFNLSDNNLVPYIALGASFIGAPSTKENANATSTLNIAFGGTFWVTHHWGLNAQYTLKFSPELYTSMVNHTQLTAGLVYSFRPRILVRRLWNRRR